MSDKNLEHLIEEARARAENEAVLFWTRCEGYGQNEGACIHQSEGGICAGCTRRWAIEQLRDLLLSFSRLDALEAALKENERLKGKWDSAGHRCPQCGTGNAKLAAAEAQIVSLRERLNKARAAMSRAMDALESDSEKDARENAWDFCAEQFEGLSDEEVQRYESIRAERALGASQDAEHVS